MSMILLAPGGRVRRFSKRLSQVLVTLFGLPVSYTHLTLPTIYSV